MQTAKPLVLCE